ncbi:MAG: maltotransferase domain-containing protein, partial [Nocardioidaceae bacterium]
MMPRIPITDVRPVVENGRYPAKATVREPFPVSARVFREGHDRLGAGVVLTGPDGVDRRIVTMTDEGNDFFRAWVAADDAGSWTFRVESWSDPYATWSHDAAVKIAAGVDVDLMLVEGAALLDRARTWVPDGTDAARVLAEAAATLRDRTSDAETRLAAGVAQPVREVLADHPVRGLLGSSPSYPVVVDRARAVAGAWYEFFPRSEGAVRLEDGSVRAGTLHTAAQRLAAVAAMGFDVIYLPPI